MANEQISEITTVPTNATVIKIINTLIKRYNSLGSIYTFKGSVQTYDDLLIIQNPNVGDVYNVVQEDEEHQIAAGSNFVWDGTVWDNLGGSLAGLVQSVNGINPDSLGNVLLPLIKNITTNQGVITFTKNDDTTIQVDNIKKLYTVGLGQTVDLNNLVEAGIYICDNDSYAANYENCPVQKSFLLEVQQANDGSMVYQFLTQYNDGSMEAGNQYVRTYQVTNGWTDWVKYVLASDLNGAVDNLTEQVTEVSTALTAHKDDHNNPHQVTAAQLGLATVYKYKGSVETYADLPTSEQQIGDVYNVKQADPDHNIKAGDNVAWDGTTWDILAGDTDLSGYAQLNSANTFTAKNAFRANIVVSNGTTAGSSGSISFGISPADETIQARIGTDNLGGLFYHASTNQPHVFRIGTNNHVFVIYGNNTKVAFSSNNNIFATVTHDGVVKWLGNANTATKLETARTINGVAFDGTKDITIEAGGGGGDVTAAGDNNFTGTNTFNKPITVRDGALAGIGGTITLGTKPNSATTQAKINSAATGAMYYTATENTGHYFKIGNNTASTSITTNEDESAIFSHNAFEFARITNDGVAKWLGNANTATKLETARTINGVSFDGTKDITIDIPEPVIASEAEAKAGTNNTKFMTPLRVKQAISTFGDSSWTISKGTNGWARENSTGLTVQWGYVNRANSIGTFTFPRTFTTCYYSNVMCSSNLVPYIKARSNTSITFNTNNGYNDDTQNWGDCYIFAIGVS